MASPELKDATTVVVDGYNLLLDLADEALVSEERDRDVARERLGDALEEWARLRSCHVVLVWDGRGRGDGRHRAPRERVREVYVAAAEADDFIVEEVRRLRDEGRRPGVVTRDRELLGRLPKSTVKLGHEQVGSDLRALAADPLRAPKLLAEHGADEIPASPPEDVDPAALPRRRRPGQPGSDPPEPAAGAARSGQRSGEGRGGARSKRTRPSAPSSPAEDEASARERRAREEAERRKQARRERYRRAQQRKKR